VPRYRVELVPAAEAEAREAYKYLLERDPRAAEEFERRFVEALEVLSESAHSWDAARGELRRYLMEPFTYALIYRLRGDVVTVGVVMHLKRHPVYWKARRF
jgi:plasmid stabilization system protein ParE